MRPCTFQGSGRRGDAGLDRNGDNPQRSAVVNDHTDFAADRDAKVGHCFRVVGSVELRFVGGVFPLVGAFCGCVFHGFCSLARVRRVQGVEVIASEKCEKNGAARESAEAPAARLEQQESLEAV